MIVRRHTGAFAAVAVTIVERKRQAMLTEEVLKSYLHGMPNGHVFDLPYNQFAQLFPPGEPDAGARAKLCNLAEECACDLTNVPHEERYELRRR